MLTLIKATKLNVLVDEAVLCTVLEVWPLQRPRCVTTFSTGVGDVMGRWEQHALKGIQYQY